VTCINPVERAAEDPRVSMQIRNGEIKYQPNIVAAQLRYGGILSAVKVARSGLPHRHLFVNFFQRYRSIVNPENPATKLVAAHVTAKDTQDYAKEQCELLIKALTNLSGQPLVVAAVQKRLAEETQIIFKRRLIRHWMSSIGGVVAEGAAKVGLTKVFISKQAHILLESCLYHQLNLCRQKIGSIVMKIVHRQRYVRAVSMIFKLQRVMRGGLARCRARLLKRKKALLAAMGTDDGIESPTKVDRYHVISLEAEVRELKKQDALIQDQIKRLVANNKVSGDEPDKLMLDFAVTKQELMNHAARFPATSVINVKTIETSEAIGEGFELLRPEKLIPQSTVGKALSFGRNSKNDNRSSAVRSANKLVTKDHPLFKNLHKLMDRLRELFELAKLERELMETRRRVKKASGIASGSNTPGKTTSDTDFGDLEIKIGTLDKIAKLTRAIYQYYHQYILEVCLCFVQRHLCVRLIAYFVDGCYSW
jgi:myosin heavy subunit